MSAQHSVGPIRLDLSTLGQEVSGHVEIHAKDHSAFALVVWQMSDDASLGRPSPKCEANAHRLVAAWNFCEGLSTELLEATTATQALGDANHQVGKLKAINAELLAALKVAEDSVGDLESLEIVRAAIAKAKATP